MSAHDGGHFDGEIKGGFGDTAENHMEPVRPEWVGRDGWMVPTFQIMVFENALDPYYATLGIPADYVETTRCSTFVVDGHLVQGAPARSGDMLRVRTWTLGGDAKALHYVHEMRLADSGLFVAGYEIMTLHVNLDRRRTAPWPEAIRARIAALAEANARRPRPGWVGRRVAMAAARDLPDGR